jgi:hypothetical protein
MTPLLSKEDPMLLVREIVFCKPGKTRPMVEKFRSLSKILEKHQLGSMRIMTDVSAEGYWMVVSEIEVPTLDHHTKMMKQTSEMPDVQALMKDYHDFVNSGRREIYTLE